VLNKEQ
jgi:serine/threonine protein kinase